MTKFDDLRRYARKNPYMFIVPIAMALVTVMTVVETTGMLPLEGQATPTYGAMPTTTVKKTSARAAVSKSSRKILRTASTASLRGAAPASTPVKWHRAKLRSRR